MRFDKLDLNLLVALDALLASRSVTVAATELCLSQSAMSGSLSRLREYFDDPLLVPVGRSMRLTDKAEGLVEPVKEVLLFIRSNIMSTPHFDPLTSERSFSILASDYAFSVLLGSVLSKMEKIAPKLRFQIAPLSDMFVDAFHKGDLDLVLTIEATALPNLGTRHLYRDDHVIIYWDENKHIGDSLDLATFLELDHAIVSFGEDRPPAMAEMEYTKAGIQRNVTVLVPTFSLLADAVVHTNRVATVHRRLATKFARYYPIKIAEAPLPLPPITEVVQWHPINDHSEATQWLVSQIVETAGELEPAPSATG